ncbi:SDR family oxidoreductase [Nocardioides sp. Kera G14]|uniref:SDR family oxidoreductase n=1 Tax=Nocardioides sp. Kera G14 TaxID=2884264 RepID=UPI001D0F91D0|nr:SDR family oxidoreductase [Nocardioides sp. Kera G14]UDY24553.1 SDR family oxidoreductase [Nocardioides sp. Kera G14]
MSASPAPGTRAVLVSGSANGIGAATVRRFAAAGWFVGIYDIDAAGAERLADELNAERPGSAVAGRLDVTSIEQWEVIVAEFVAAAGGRLDLLVNNAGILRGGRFADLPIAAHHATIAINVDGVINGCYAAHPHLAATPGSGVINLCSASAIYGQAELAAYSASKFAVRGLTEALELEWRKEGIRVQGVWPLFVDTAMTEGLHIGSTDTLGVNLTPADVADQILAMAQPPRGLLGRLRPPKVHTAVGAPARIFQTLADLGPSFVVREVNRRITHS